MKKEIRDYTIDENGLLGVQAISVVEHPAIESDFIMLSSQKFKFSGDAEKGILYGAVLIPDKLIYREDADGTPYYGRFSKELIERLAHDYLLKNLQHNATVEHAFAVQGLTVVESWVKMGDSDKSVSLGFDHPEGTWFIGMKVNNDDVKEKAKRGEIKGFSIEAFLNEKVSMSKEQAFLFEVEQLLKSC